LNRKTADVSDKSPDQRFREPSVVQIENVLNHIISERILNKVQRVEDDLSDELKSLRRGCVIDGSLQDTTSVSVGCDFDQVGCDGIVDELVVFRYKLVQALLDDLQSELSAFQSKTDKHTWLPLRSLIKATTFMDKA